MNSAVPILSFNDRVNRFLEHVEYRLATTDDERDAIFRLRYDGYLRDGGIGPNGSKRFSDRWDDAPNALLFGVHVDGELASTVRMHISTPFKDDLPAFEPFGDVLSPLADQGLTLVDPTRFVIDEHFARFGPEIPFVTLRLTSMAAEHFGAHGILATVRKEHTIMYRRVVGHRAISEPRTYPLLSKPIVCMLVETAALAEVAYRRHPFLQSTVQERETVFKGFNPAGRRGRIQNPANEIVQAAG
jgi:hypothetical protein